MVDRKKEKKKQKNKKYIADDHRQQKHVYLTWQMDTTPQRNFRRMHARYPC